MAWPAGQFKAAAREHGADEASDAFERIVKQMTRTKSTEDDDG